MINIRTKAHKVLPILDTGQVVLVAPPGGTAPYVDLNSDIGVHLDFERFKTFVTAAGRAPRFVIDPELQGIVKEKDSQRSLLDMKRADVLHLPFPVMWVELPSDRGHTLVLLWEMDKMHGDLPVGRDMLPPPEEASDGYAPGSLPVSDLVFGAYVITINKDKDGEYLSLAANFTYMGIQGRNGEPWLGLSAIGTPFFTGNADALNDHVKKTYPRMASNAWFAVTSALLLLRTRGITREVIECEKLNKRRVPSGKPAIPRHTYIRIGHVYKSAADQRMVEYDARRSPRPHWRRGHSRGVRYGVGREKIKDKWFDPMIVALADDMVEPSPPTYIPRK